MMKGIKSFCIIWPKMRHAGSGLVPLAYHFRPDLDPLLILQRQAKVVALVEPTLMVSGAARSREFGKILFGSQKTPSVGSKPYSDLIPGQRRVRKVRVHKAEVGHRRYF